MTNKVIYTASKPRHHNMWKDLRAKGYRINSTWLDEAEEGQTDNYSDLWSRCISEASSCHVLILYYQFGDGIHKGALVEAGAALASGKYVLVVGSIYNLGWSFIEHPKVITCDTIEDALHLLDSGAI